MILSENGIHFFRIMLGMSASTVARRILG
jgi:hypothetical protein